MLYTIIASSCPSRRREGTSWGQPLLIGRLGSVSVNLGTTTLPLIIRPSILRLQDNWVSLIVDSRVGSLMQTVRWVVLL